MRKPNSLIDSTDTDQTSNDARRRGIGFKAGVALLASATGLTGGGYLLGHAGKNTGSTTSVVQFQTPAQQLNYNAILALAGQVEHRAGLRHATNPNGTVSTEYKASPSITVEITSGPLGKSSVSGVETDVYYTPGNTKPEELISVTTSQTNFDGAMAQVTETFSGGQGDLDIESNSALVTGSVNNSAIASEQFALITNLQTEASLSVDESSYLTFNVSDGQLNLLNDALGTPGALDPSIVDSLPGSKLPMDFYIS